MRKNLRYLAVGLLLGLALTGPANRAASQAVADNAADLSVEHPLYSVGAGPLVAVDEGHNNYHTLDGRYAPFGALLKNDGYRLVSLQGRFDQAALAPVRVLVVANPLAATNVASWTLPTPSAFDDREIAAVEAWVRNGGALFLIADHMPFAGAADKLAQAFGFRFENVYAVKGDGRSPEIFNRLTNTLEDTEIARGRDGRRAVEQVQSFTGSAFRAPPTATTILALDEGWTLLYPFEAGEFGAEIPRRTATQADLRGAALDYGKGRVVVFSEAAMFTNQLVRGASVGFGRPTATHNKRFLLNIVEWLSRPDAAATPPAKAPLP